MKKTLILSICVVGSLLFASCNDEAKKEETTEVSAAEPAKPVVAEVAKPDMAQIRSEITALETSWATALNAKDINALMAMYADDAQSMQDGGPTLVGKAAIKEQNEKDFAGKRSFTTIAFETTDLYAQDNVVTEIGKTFYKNAEGKVSGTGKYIALFEKRGGKYLCIREIYNNDKK